MPRITIEKDLRSSSRRALPSGLMFHVSRDLLRRLVQTYIEAEWSGR
jgi:hypothetical protein